MIIQEQVLNYILDNKDSSFITQNSLNLEHFYNYKDEFSFIKSYLSKYGTIPDKSTFIDKFPNFTFIDVTESKEFLLNTLCHEREKQIYREEVQKSISAFNNDDMDKTLSIISKMEGRIRNGKNIQSVDIVSDITRYDDFLNKSLNFDSFYVSTGFEDLDLLLGGGFDRKEELATIVARPGVGKSWILLAIAKAAAVKGLNVGLYSGEMSWQKVAYRFDTLYGHLSNTSITHGNIEIQNQYKQYIDTLSTSINGHIRVITPNDIGDSATVDDLQAFIERENLDMLCIDQHSLLKDRNNAKNPVDRASNISRDLKNLQVKAGIPIIAVSQQHRNNLDNSDGAEVTLDVSHIAQADRIGQDSTVVLFLEQKDGILTITLAKSRDGVSGKKVRYLVNLDTGKFEPIRVGDDSDSMKQCDDYKDAFDSGAPIFDGESCPSGGNYL